MSAHTKRKTSGVTGLELQLTLDRLRQFRSSIDIEEVPESGPTPTDTFADELDNMIAALESKAHSPLSLSFSAADRMALDKLNIIRKGTLFLRPEALLQQAINNSRTAGADKEWTNDMMYKHLSFLSRSCTNENHSSRLIIDTFFFRSAAMVPSPRNVVMMLEKHILSINPRQSKMDTIPGTIDYTIIVAESPDIASNFIEDPPAITRANSDEMTVFFAAEAKATGIGVALKDHLPQALLDLVACAKHLGKSHIRGALTTGFAWYFLAVDLDDNGAQFWVSELVEWRYKPNRIVKETSDEYDPALIAGILSSWMPESFSKFSDDQWFVGKLRGGGRAQ